MPGAGSARNAPDLQIQNGKQNGFSTVAPQVMIEGNPKVPETRLYKKRWAILVMFCLLSASNGAQWIIYSIISPIISDFYGVSYAAINWTSMVYMLTYIFFFIPAAWLLDKYGLRLSILLGAAGNCIGAWIRIFSTTPDAFWITMIGQTIVGASQMFTLGAPPRLAAVWFGADEVSTACAAGVFGNQLGIAIGFVLPPMIVQNGTSEEVAEDLMSLFLYSAVLNTIIFTLIICFFSARPKMPPSYAQITALEQSIDSNFMGTMKKLLTNKEFLLLFLTYGMNTGVFYAVSTILAEMIEVVYPGESEASGRIGLAMVLAGMFGSVVGGVCLDKFKKFKLITFVVYFFSFLGMVFFTFTLELDISMVYTGAIALGFFMTGYLPIGFEFAAELTFPCAEGTMSGLLNASAQIFGIALTWAAGSLLHWLGIFTSNTVMIGVLILGTILTALIREDLKRQKAQKAQVHLPTSETQLTSYTVVAD
ncbi:unnamed protein product, partial [Mesorhabditis belari]|uniref:Choline/ethanolamine transporter FLVCR1 n=1 Tax=Mesorhabditis belari TaxID=2138241 RepID=A0AAF3FAU4_9BILA